MGCTIKSSRILQDELEALLAADADLQGETSPILGMSYCLMASDGTKEGMVEPTVCGLVLSEEELANVRYVPHGIIDALYEAGKTKHFEAKVAVVHTCKPPLLYRFERLRPARSIETLLREIEAIYASAKVFCEHGTAPDGWELSGPPRAALLHRKCDMFSAGECPF